MNLPSYGESEHVEAAMTVDGIPITVGAGKDRPRGKRVTVPVNGAPVAAFAAALEQIEPGTERWWSPHLWREDYRAEDRWESAFAAFADLDHYDAVGEHTAPAADLRTAFRDAIESDKFLGSFYHHTPHGERVGVVFARCVTDPGLWESTARAVCALMQSSLDAMCMAATRAMVPDGKGGMVEKWTNGYAVDRGASCDLARLLYTPRSIVDGETRDAQVIVLREHRYDPEALCVAGLSAETAQPKAATPHRPAARNLVGGDLEGAIRRWNADHAENWGRPGSGTCPICGHNECFGQMDDDADRWYCFSSQHTGCGLQGEKGWHGDALDLEAHRAGVGRIEILRRDGYLAPPKGNGRHDDPCPTEVDAPHADQPRRPEIRITTEAPAVVNAAEEALLAEEACSVYQRGSLLVRVVRDGARAVPGLIRQIEAPVIVPEDEPHLTEILSRAADWRRFDKRSNAWVRSLPATWVVKMLLARREWSFPVLEGVSEIPVLRPGGTICTTPGYDEETAILYDPGGSVFPPISEQPTREDAETALAVLSVPLVDFPFKENSDRAAAIASILTIIGRSGISGPCPLIAFRSPTPGSGKGLLVDTAAIIGTGRPAARMSAPGDDAESRKRILAIALEGTAVLLVDNVSGAFGSDSLAAALTANTWSDRVLGQSRTAKAPLRAVWIVTGNGISFKGDLGRRVMVCDLDPECEHPEDRTGFRYSDLLAAVRARRPELVWAAMTLLRAFIVAGRPEHGQPVKGSFEGWDGLVRAALIWAGAGDPLGTTQRVREEGDQELAALRSVLIAWKAEFDRPTTAAAAVERSKDRDASGRERHPELAVALAEFADVPTAKLDARRLGYKLRTWADRIAGGLRFVRDRGNTGGAVRWAVRGGDGGDGGDDPTEPIEVSPDTHMGFVE